MTTTPNDLAWKREGTDWVLKAGKRRFGRVVPDATYPGMWRPVLLNRPLGSTASASGCESIILDAAVRELEWEIAQRSVRHPHFPAKSEDGFFCRHRRPLRQPMRPLPTHRPAKRSPAARRGEGSFRRT